MMFGQQQPPQYLANQATQAFANNQIAAGAQQAANKTYAGAGLSRGRGHMALDRNRGDVARANAFGQAQQARMEDQFQNSSLMSQYRAMNENEAMQYDSLAEQNRASQWDSRFGNMTTAWGALAGLLR